MGRGGDSGEKKGLWGERIASGEEVATVEKGAVVRERGVGVEVPGTEDVTNTGRRFSSNSYMSASIGVSPESPCPGASMPVAVVVVDIVFVEARMWVGPVGVGDGLVTKTGSRVMGVWLSKPGAFRDDKRGFIVLISAVEGGFFR